MWCKITFTLCGAVRGDAIRKGGENLVCHPAAPALAASLMVWGYALSASDEGIAVKGYRCKQSLDGHPLGPLTIQS